MLSDPGKTALDGLIPGQTALDGLITAKKRQKVVSRETADVVRVEDELQPRCRPRRGRTWGKFGTASDAEERFELLKTILWTSTDGTCDNARLTLCSRRLWRPPFPKT